MTGDLKVVEPGHEPLLESFQDLDYDFYRALLATGLIDAYRTLDPTTVAHSWLSGRFGAQRLDHFLTAPASRELASCDYDHAPGSPSSETTSA